MVDLCLAKDFRRLVWIVLMNGEVKNVACSSPEARVRSHGNGEVGEIVGVREVDLSSVASVQLGDI